MKIRGRGGGKRARVTEIDSASYLKLLYSDIKQKLGQVENKTIKDFCDFVLSFEGKLQNPKLAFYSLIADADDHSLVNVVTFRSNAADSRINSISAVLFEKKAEQMMHEKDLMELAMKAWRYIFTPGTCVQETTFENPII